MTEYNIISLRGAIELKSGINGTDRQNCEKISIQIFKQNGDYLSTTTIMRIFGLILMPEADLSPAVIEIINRFCKHDF